MLPRKLRRAAALAPADWLALGRAALVLAFIRVGLATLGYGRVRGFLDGRSPATEPGGGDVAELERLALAVDIAARHSPGEVACLPRALTLYRLARGAGAPATLRFGVLRPGDRLLAHAWVEIEGEVLGDRPDIGEGFAPLEPAVP